MINYDSILSAFDGKPTLLQWLKMVKKALDESILKNVNITQNGQKVVFTFNFEDGTSISTPEVTLPKGDKGDNGVGIVIIETTGYKIVGEDTESTIRVELSDGTIKQFKTYAKNGVRITGIDTVNDEVVGDKTLTTLRANYSDNTNDEFVVMAKNGSSGNIYLHSVKLTKSNSSKVLYLNLYSRKETLTIDDVFAQIPTNNYIPMCFIENNANAVLSVKKVPDNTYGDFINVTGIGTNNGSSSSYSFSFYKKDITFTDTLLGVNL